MSGLNRISFVIPASSSTAAAQRDESIGRLISVLAPAQYDLYHYGDTNSGNGIWEYYAIIYGFVDGILTIGTVLCTGMISPPVGSDIMAASDPGAGVFSWTGMGYPHRLIASGSGGSVSPPSGNNNYYVWDVTAQGAGDFATAIAATESALAGAITSNGVVKRYFKYVDSVSGAWQVWAIYFGAGSAQFGTTSSVDVIANNNVLYVITCAGSPHPPTGSPMIAAPFPAFSETFTTLNCRLNFGPQR